MIQKTANPEPNRRQLSSSAQSTSLTEVPIDPEPRSREYSPPKVRSSREQIYRRGSRRYIFVPESPRPAAATSSRDQIFCCSFDSGTHPRKRFDGEERKRQYFVASWKVISECWWRKGSGLTSRLADREKQFWEAAERSVHRE